MFDSLSSRSSAPQQQPLSLGIPTTDQETPALLFVKRKRYTYKKYITWIEAIKFQIGLYTQPCRTFWGNFLDYAIYRRILRTKPDRGYKFRLIFIYTTQTVCVLLLSDLCFTIYKGAYSIIKNKSSYRQYTYVTSAGNTWTTPGSLKCSSSTLIQFHVCELHRTYISYAGGGTWESGCLLFMAKLVYLWTARDG